jgi:hypothetical protein
MKNVLSALVILIILSSSNCKKTESLVYISEFEIINATDTGLTIRSWLDYRKQKDIYIEKGKSYYTKEVGESPIIPSQFWGSDSLEIKFDDDKVLLYTWNKKSPTEQNILQNDWENIKIATRHNKDIYKIGKEHRDSAK